MIGVCTVDNSLKSSYLGAFDKTWSYYMNNGNLYCEANYKAFG